MNNARTMGLPGILLTGPFKLLPLFTRTLWEDTNSGETIYEYGCLAGVIELAVEKGFRT